MSINIDIDTLVNNKIQKQTIQTNYGEVNKYTLKQDVNASDLQILNETNYIEIESGSIFDGNNYTIDLSGLIFDGLFRINNLNNRYTQFINIKTINGTLRDENINFINEELLYSGGGGFILQSQQKNFYIENCHSTGIIGKQCGGIIGSGGILGADVNIQNNSKNIIVNCSSKGIIHNSGGGITGFNTKDIIIRNCTSEGEILDEAGGIVGAYSSNLEVLYCSSFGKIKGTSSGGIVGSHLDELGLGFFNIEKCFSRGDIIYSGGGIIGGYICKLANIAIQNDNKQRKIQNCYSSGSIGSFSGGIIGFGCNSVNLVEIIGCFTLGNIDGVKAGGIAGSHLNYNRRPGIYVIQNCYSVGNINGVESGGITGFRSRNVVIQNCYSSGNVIENSFAGGICGNEAGFENSIVILQNTFSNTQQQISNTSINKIIRPVSPTFLNGNFLFNNDDISNITNVLNTESILEERFGFGIQNNKLFILKTQINSWVYDDDDDDDDNNNIQLKQFLEPIWVKEEISNQIRFIETNDLITFITVNITDEDNEIINIIKKNINYLSINDIRFTDSLNTNITISNFIQEKYNIIEQNFYFTKDILLAIEPKLQAIILKNIGIPLIFLKTKYTLNEILEAQFDISELNNTYTNEQELTIQLLEQYYSLQEIKNIRTTQQILESRVYSIDILKQNDYTIDDIKDHYTLKEIYDSNSFSLLTIKDKFTITEVTLTIKNTDILKMKYSVKELLETNVRFGIGDYLINGYVLKDFEDNEKITTLNGQQDIVPSGLFLFSDIQLKPYFNADVFIEYKYSIVTLDTMGYTLPELKHLFRPTEIKLLNKYTLEQMLNVEYTYTELLELIDSETTSESDFKLENFIKDISIPLFILKQNNILLSEIHAINFSLDEDNAPKYEYYSLNEYIIHYTFDEIFDLYIEDTTFNIDEELEKDIIKRKNISINALLQYNPSRYTITKLKEFGFTDKEIRRSNFSISDLCNNQIELILEDLRVSQPLDVLFNNNFTLLELKQSGFTIKDFVDSLIPPLDNIFLEKREEERLRRLYYDASFSISEFVSAKYDLQDIIRIFKDENNSIILTLEEILNSGFRLSELLNPDNEDIRNLIQNNETFPDLTGQTETETEIRNFIFNNSNYNINEYLQNDFTLPFLINSGRYTNQDFVNIGVNLLLLKDNGFLLNDVLNGPYTIRELIEAGYNIYDSQNTLLPSVVSVFRNKIMLELNSQTTFYSFYLTYILPVNISTVFQQNTNNLMNCSIRSTDALISTNVVLYHIRQGFEDIDKQILRQNDTTFVYIDNNMNIQYRRKIILPDGFFKIKESYLNYNNSINEIQKSIFPIDEETGYYLKKTLINIYASPHQLNNPIINRNLFNNLKIYFRFSSEFNIHTLFQQNIQLQDVYRVIRRVSNGRVLTRGGYSIINTIDVDLTVLEQNYLNGIYGANIDVNKSNIQYTSNELLMSYTNEQIQNMKNNIFILINNIINKELTSQEKQFFNTYISINTLKNEYNFKNLSITQLLNLGYSEIESILYRFNKEENLLFQIDIEEISNDIIKENLIEVLQNDYTLFFKDTEYSLLDIFFKNNDNDNDYNKSIDDFINFVINLNISLNLLLKVKNIDLKDIYTLFFGSKKIYTYEEIVNNKIDEIKVYDFIFDVFDIINGSNENENIEIENDLLIFINQLLNIEYIGLENILNYEINRTNAFELYFKITNQIFSQDGSGNIVDNGSIIVLNEGNNIVNYYLSSVIEYIPFKLFNDKFVKDELDKVLDEDYLFEYIENNILNNDTYEDETYLSIMKILNVNKLSIKNLQDELIKRNFFLSILDIYNLIIIRTNNISIIRDTIQGQIKLLLENNIETINSLKTLDYYNPKSNDVINNKFVKNTKIFSIKQIIECGLDYFTLLKYGLNSYDIRNYFDIKITVDDIIVVNQKFTYKEALDYLRVTGFELLRIDNEEVLNITIEAIKKQHIENTNYNSYWINLLRLSEDTITDINGNATNYVGKIPLKEIPFEEILNTGNTISKLIHRRDRGSFVPELFIENSGLVNEKKILNNYGIQFFERLIRKTNVGLNLSSLSPNVEIEEDYFNSSVKEQIHGLLCVRSINI
jgi:hypothetical protein